MDLFLVYGQHVGSGALLYLNLDPSDLARGVPGCGTRRPMDYVDWFGDPF